LRDNWVFPQKEVCFIRSNSENRTIGG
jgi:hypothetical protein